MVPRILSFQSFVSWSINHPPGHPLGARLKVRSHLHSRGRRAAGRAFTRRLGRPARDTFNLLCPLHLQQLARGRHRAGRDDFRWGTALPTDPPFALSFLCRAICLLAGLPPPRLRAHCLLIMWLMFITRHDALVGRDLRDASSNKYTGNFFQAILSCAGICWL